jgi:hypothetical protein
MSRTVLRHTAILSLLVCSVVINIAQTLKIRQLRNNLAIIKAEGQLKPGAPLAEIEGRDINGKLVSIRYQRFFMSSRLSVAGASATSRT